MFSVEIRGLDSTRTSPWVCSNWITPSKSLKSKLPVKAPLSSGLTGVLMPVMASVTKLPTPKEPWPVTLVQLIPAWNSSLRSTSRILVSRIT
ncbi:hypothetical protein D3C84_933350 [compost metagenome]